MSISSPRASVTPTGASIAPPRTTIAVEDLKQLDVLHRILKLLNEPAASATALAGLIDQMPVLSGRLAARFRTRFGERPSTTASKLAFLGNRDFEALLFELLEDLTLFSAEQS